MLRGRKEARKRFSPRPQAADSPKPLSPSPCYRSQPPALRPCWAPRKDAPHFPPGRLPAVSVGEDPVLPPMLPVLGPLLQEALQAVTTPSPSTHTPISLAVTPGRGNAPPVSQPRGPVEGMWVYLVLILPACSCLLSPSENGQFRPPPFQLRGWPSQAERKSGDSGRTRQGQRQLSGSCTWLDSGTGPWGLRDACAWSSGPAGMAWRGREGRKGARPSRP